jgi:hypothetical protein
VRAASSCDRRLATSIVSRSLCAASLVGLAQLVVGLRPVRGEAVAFGRDVLRRLLLQRVELRPERAHRRRLLREQRIFVGEL